MRLISFVFVFGVILGFCSTGCAVKGHVVEQPQKTETAQDKRITDMQMTVEEMTREGHALYQHALKDGKSKEEAANKTAEFLRAQKNVSRVDIIGPDTIKVIFIDGNDLLMLLGRERL